MRSARVLEGDSRTTIASSGKTSASAVWTVEELSGSVAGISSGPGLGSGAGRADSGDLLEQRLEGELDVGDDRVAHRRAGRLVGVAGDRDQRRALGQQRPGDVGVVGEDRGADDEDQVVALEGLADRADRRRQDAVEVGVVLGEAEPAAAGRRARPDRQALALGERDGGVPAAAGVDVGAGDEDRVGGAVEPLGERADRLGVGGGAAARPGGAIAWADVGLVDLGVPVVHRDRDEGRALRRQRGEVGAAGEGERHVLGAGGLVAPLDERVRHAGRVAVGEVRLQGDLRPHLLAGGDQQRRVVGLGVEDRAHRVADAGGGVEVDERGAARGLRVAVGHADDDRLLQAEHVAEVVGKSASIGSSVEPGLPNIVVIPRARKRSKLASRTVGIGAPYLPTSFKRAKPVPIAGNMSRQGQQIDARRQALLRAARQPGGALRADHGRARRLGGLAGRRRPGDARARSTRPAKIVPIPASIPHEEGDMVDRRILPDLRWIAEHFPIYVTDGYSGPLPERRARRLQPLPHPQLRPLQRPRRRPRPEGGGTKCDAAWTADHPARPLGRAGPEQPRPPFRWVGYDGDAGHGCGHHLHLSWNHAPAPEYRLAEWVEVLPTGHLDVTTPPATTAAAAAASAGETAAARARPAASPRSRPAASPRID